MPASAVDSRPGRHRAGVAVEDVSLLLVAAREGDRDAAARLFAAVYDDLHRLARGQLARGGAGPGATSLVHEAYLRLARPQAMQVNDREHFFAVAARAMRQLAIDHARERAAGKRGGGRADEPLDGLSQRIGSDGREQLIELDQALTRLAAVDPALVRLVEMRFFAGLELAEIAVLTGRSERSLKRDWRKARAILHATLGDAAPESSDD